MSTTVSSAALHSALRSLRNRYLLRRGLEILAIALALDLILDALSVATYTLFDVPLRKQFFLEVFIVLLLARAAVRARESTFFSFLDRSFSLKDRLYSFREFGRSLSLPSAVREAQAAECLRSIDFDQIRRRLRPRIPLSLLVTLPLFASLMFYYMDAEYRPPGPIGRTVISVLVPNDADHRLAAQDRLSQPAGGQEDRAKASPPETAEESTDTGSGAASQDPASASGSDVADGKGETSPAVRAVPDEEAMATPQEVQSHPVTDEVSPVGKARLADRGALPPAAEPQHLLGLIP